jgi:hypothetical protein
VFDVRALLVDIFGHPFGTLTNPIRNEQVGVSSSELVDPFGNPIGVPGNPITVTGGGGGGGPVTIADGSDVAEGSTTDVAVQAITRARFQQNSGA